jgi:putative SOS response-associated peptidase YedK
VRVESVARAPQYRDAFRRRRCLVIVDGFFEWQRRGEVKQPFFVRREDHKPFALAGIWEPAVTTDGEVVDCCAVITGDAKGAVAELHDRMPLIVPAAGYARWLDPDRGDLADLLVPSGDGLVAYPVSAFVNSPDNDDRRCIEPLAAGAEAKGSLLLF